MDPTLSSLRKYIPDFIISTLDCPGKTIDQIRQKHTRRFGDDSSQIQYESKPIWHTRLGLIQSLGQGMKVGVRYWGPKRKSADFHNMIDQEISKLRRKGIIIDWAGGGTGIFRLAPGTSSVKKPTMGLEEGIPDADATDMTISLKETFISILRHGGKANTYKFALARALVEYCRDTPPGTTSRDIPYSYFADKFLEYYWHQQYKYHIKQDFMTHSSPKVIQAIDRVFKNSSHTSFEQVTDAEKLEGRKMILRDVFGHARSKTSLVVPKFQNISRGGSAVLRTVFYEYDDDAKIIHLRPEAFDFFRNNHVILSMAILSEWAKFLEKINKSLPMLVAKIEQVKPHRGSLVRYRNIYLEHTCHCFYCGDRLEADYMDVDHFLPWSYIFENQMWNLVLACQKCNGKKSASLPQEEFRHEIIQRNHSHRDRIRELDRSLRIIDTRFGWKREIENHYTACREYGFGVVVMP